MVGQRFNFQSYAQAQKGGIMLYPASGVVEGVDVTAVSGTGNVATITLTKGVVKLDGNRMLQPLTSVAVTLDAGIDLAADSVEFNVYLNPKRKVEFYLAGAAQPTPTTDAKVLEVLPYGDYYIVNKIYQEDQGVWRLLDPMKDLKQGYHGWNNMPLNDIDTVTPIDATYFSYEPEKAIFHSTALPPHIAKPSNAMLRQSASIEIATISFEGGVGTVVSGVKDEYRLLV